jgi:hypothetical protein
MRTPSVFSPARLPLLALLVGCVGAPCDCDSDCPSGRCVDGYCSTSVYDGTIWNDGTDADEPPAPRCIQVSCGELFGAEACTSRPGCEPVFESCFGLPTTCTIQQTLDRTCPTPCGLRDERSCGGECRPTFTCVQARDLSCGSRRAEVCAEQAGCVLVP